MYPENKPGLVNYTKNEAVNTKTDSCLETVEFVEVIKKKQKKKYYYTQIQHKSATFQLHGWVETPEMAEERRVVMQQINSNCTVTTNILTKIKENNATNISDQYTDEAHETRRI